MGSYSETPPLQEADAAPGTNSLYEKTKNEEIPLIRASGLTLVLNTPKGRGVFARYDIPANEVIEISPVLVLSPEENAEHICKTELYHYSYNWPLPLPTPHSTASKPQLPKTQTQTQTTTTQAIVFGLGSLLNHSTHHQNIGWKRSLPTKTITYTTLRPIKAGEELCISYGSRLTFTDVDARKYEEDCSEDEGELGGLGRIELD